MLSTIARLGVPYVLMYCKNPSGRADLESTKHENIVQYVSAFFQERIDTALAAGIKKNQLILDPGMGAFISTDPQDSIKLLQNIPYLIQKF